MYLFVLYMFICLCFHVCIHVSIEEVRCRFTSYIFFTLLHFFLLPPFVYENILCHICRRAWNEDEPHITAMLRSNIEFPSSEEDAHRSSIKLLIFPEGTNLCESGCFLFLSSHTHTHTHTHTLFGWVIFDLTTVPRSDRHQEYLPAIRQEVQPARFRPRLEPPHSRLHPRGGHHESSGGGGIRYNVSLSSQFIY